MLCGFGHTVTTCCEAVALFWVLRLTFENGQVFHATLVDVTWCCGRFTRFVQQCWTRACALVRFSIPNMSQHVATGWLNARNLLCLTMLRYVTLNCCWIVWLELANAWPKLLGYVVFICRDRLAGALRWGRWIHRKNRKFFTCTTRHETNDGFMN